MTQNLLFNVVQYRENLNPRNKGSVTTTTMLSEKKTLEVSLSMFERYKGRHDVLLNDTYTTIKVELCTEEL